MMGTKPSLATCATFWESVTPSKRRTATYIALAHLLREGGTRWPRLELINVVPSVKGHKGCRNFREFVKGEVLRISLPRTQVNRASPEMRQASWAGNISAVLRCFLKRKRGMNGKGEGKRVHR